MNLLALSLEYEMVFGLDDVLQNLFKRKHGPFTVFGPFRIICPHAQLSHIGAFSIDKIWRCEQEARYKVYIISKSFFLLMCCFHSSKVLIHPVTIHGRAQEVRLSFCSLTVDAASSHYNLCHTRSSSTISCTIVVCQAPRSIRIVFVNRASRVPRSPVNHPEVYFPPARSQANG